METKHFLIKVFPNIKINASNDRKNGRFNAIEMNARVKKPGAKTI